MYAIIEDSGTQIRVEAGQTIDIDLRDLPESGGSVTFDRVLMIGEPGGKTQIGKPYLEGATVTADVVDAEFKGEKIDVIKYKRRKGYKRKQGHRQRYSRVKVTAING